MSQAGVGRESDKFMLRFPDGMRDALKEDAAKNGRSLNSEIVARLEDYDRLLDTQEKLEGDVRELKGLLLEATRDRKHADMTAQTLAGRVETLEARNEELEQQVADLTQILLTKDVQPAPPTPENTLYVLIDAEDVPTSWPEIQAHLGQILRAGGVQYDRIDAKVLAKNMRSSADRDDEWLDLLMAYRNRIAGDRIGASLKKAKKPKTD